MERDPHFSAVYSNSTPRAWATAMPVVRFVLKNSSLDGDDIRLQLADQVLHIGADLWYSRRESGSPAGVVMAP